jgi:hypothetical protein
MASSSGEVEVRSGAEVSVKQPSRHGAGLGLLDFFFLCLVWLRAFEPASTRDNTAAAAAQRFHAASLVLARGSGVRVLAEGVGITFREDFHQPAIKVIHWMVHDGFEAPVVLSVSFFNVVT